MGKETILTWECKYDDRLTHRIVALKGNTSERCKNDVILWKWKIMLVDEQGRELLCVWDYCDVPPSLCDCVLLLSQNIQETLIKFAKYGTKVEDKQEECDALDEDQEIYEQTKNQMRNQKA